MRSLMGKSILRAMATWRPMTQEWYAEMGHAREHWQRYRAEPVMTTAEWMGLLFVVIVVMLLVVLGVAQHGYAPPGDWGY